MTFFNILEDLLFYIDGIIDELVGIATIAQPILIAFGFLFVYHQLRRMKIDREHTNFSTIMERVHEHNNYIANDKLKRKVVETFEGLNEGDELYWATRLVHLSHLNLLMQVWLLAGKPKKLCGDYSGWNNFAILFAKDITGKTTNQKPPSYHEACQGIWEGLRAYEIYPKEFVNWLKHLSEIDQVS